MKLPHFLLFCACISASGLTLAEGHGRGQQDGRGADKGGFGQSNNFDRSRPERYERFEPQRDQRAQREQMSDEERRQLRRDVNDAGREIYRRPDRF